MHLKQFTDNNIIRTGNEIIVPAGRFEDFLTVLRILKITKAGTRICSVKAGKYLPSHEIAMSVFYRKESFPVVNLNLDQALTYLSRGHLILDNAQRGWNIVCYNGVNLGFINNIGSRLNNYYPVNWRIRIKCSEQGKENILRWK